MYTCCVLFHILLITYTITILLLLYIGDLEGAKAIIQSCISSLAIYFPHKNTKERNTLATNSYSDSSSLQHLPTNSSSANTIPTTDATANNIDFSNNNDNNTNNDNTTTTPLPAPITPPTPSSNQPHDTLVNKYGTSHMKLIKYLTSLSDIARLKGEYTLAINYAIDAINIAFVSSMNLHSNLLPIDTTTAPTTTTNATTTTNTTNTAPTTTASTTTTNNTATTTNIATTTATTNNTTTNMPIHNTTSIKYIYDKTILADLPKLLLAYNKPKLSLIYAIYTLGLVYFDHQLYTKAALCFELCISYIDNIILLLHINTILFVQRCKLWLAYTYAYLYKLEDSHKMVAKASKSISTLLGMYYQCMCIPFVYVYIVYYVDVIVLCMYICIVYVVYVM